LAAGGIARLQNAAARLMALKMSGADPRLPGRKCPRYRERSFLLAGKLTNAKPGKFRQ
jgi:hypothetical protein